MKRSGAVFVPSDTGQIAAIAQHGLRMLGDSVLDPPQQVRAGLNEGVPQGDAEHVAVGEHQRARPSRGSQIQGKRGLSLLAVANRRVDQRMATTFRQCDHTGLRISPPHHSFRPDG